MTTTPELDEAAVRLSTAPLPVGPQRSRQLLAPVRRAWRQLTSMRTALLLLFLLALGAVPGGFLPQRSLNPVRVDQYIATHPTLAPLLDRLSLFDVFAAPWFAAVYLLLFISLVGCLVPRIRLHARALRKPPPQAPGNLSRLPVSARWETQLPVEQALDAARRSLRRGRWRTVARPAAVSAEKGYLRETGNLVFHVSLVVLLVGIAVGQFFGFKGTVLLKEGSGFANAIANYDDIHPGRRFHDSSLVPLHFTLDDFTATYGPDGKARTFDAQVHFATTRCTSGPRRSTSSATAIRSTWSCARRTARSLSTRHRVFRACRRTRGSSASARSRCRTPAGHSSASRASSRRRPCRTL
jgi:cytochrome c biogenesis protein